MPTETQRTPRHWGTELLRLFVFVVVTSLVSNGIVWLTGWSLLYVLLTVNTAGLLVLVARKRMLARHERAEGQTG